MARVARIVETGGPDVIQWFDVDLPPPAAGEVRMRNHAIGLNFIDTYYRSGLYSVPLPTGLGSEAAGEIVAVGPEVAEFAMGDRVAVFGPALGAYATERNVAASSLFRVPDAISYEVAAGALLKGCTAEFLIERCARMERGGTALVHAAAGGVGQILVQWLKAIGAIVIATVGSERKRETVKALGADHILLSRSADLAAQVRELTNGRGVDVVFDGVGAATWEASLKATRRRGLVISYGNASGPVTGVDLATLNQHGSLFVTRPKAFDYYAEPAERVAGAERLFAMLASGSVKIDIAQRFPLEDAAAAHRLLEAGETMGSTIFLP